MKMRYIAAGYTVVAIMLLCFIHLQLNKDNYYETDMVYYNRQLQQVINELDKLPSMDKEEIYNLQESYNCIILYTQDKEYQKRLNKYIGEGAIIFDYMVDDGLVGKIIWEMSKNKYEESSRQKTVSVVTIAIIIILAGYLMLAVLYYLFVRPFHVLDKFSSEVAKGNLDFKLPMEKRNMFGAFTESFDIMREELKMAREREYQANISKKELVASLSHDIKTPVSTIKATCEVIQIKEQKQDTKDKIDIIINKADMIDQLVSNMFHATMEELEALRVDAGEESSLAIPEMFNDLKYYGKIVMDNEIPKCLVHIDKLRMKQVIDNVVNNSYKYAGTDIHVSFLEYSFMDDDGIENKGISVIIKDSGLGVPEEEMALVTEKFYRGSNAKGKSGSGIGMYLSKTFMAQMGGELHYYNDNGFVVELFVRKV